jgi:hypothetical protein
MPISSNDFRVMAGNGTVINLNRVIGAATNYCSIPREIEDRLALLRMFYEQFRHGCNGWAGTREKQIKCR